MVNLPEEFVKQTRELMGEDRFARYLAAFDEEPPVSIRLNRRCTSHPLDPSRGSEYHEVGKITDEVSTSLPSAGGVGGEAVPWCRHAFYLSERPNFTFDPLLHAGCYYVQEAASMFLDTVLQQHLPHHPVMMLDLCAAPGGKSTLARTALPEGSVLLSNEPMRQRANILLENITKWGYDNSYVTNNFPKDYRRSKLMFDVILCDVPCSGEGMFRKDSATIGEWSQQNVERCWRLQREIVSDAWACLHDGGLLIYSTCTFNTKENEENIKWMLSEFDAEALVVNTQADWNITGSLLPGFDAPVYRFIPGITRGEGLFMCVIRKGGQPKAKCFEQSYRLLQAMLSNVPSKAMLYFLQSPTIRTDAPQVELDYQQAVAYLRGEALVLPADTPRGQVEVRFMHHPLGLMKNIGSRANNLYPKEWRIKSTHVPQDYSPVIFCLSASHENT